MKKLLILGFGYTAQALAFRLLPKGWSICATARRSETAEALTACGIEPVVWPGDLSSALATASHILATAAPSVAGDPFLSASSSLANAPADWVGYLSTTGVYGDHMGNWVDEETPLTPSTTRGAQRVTAEAEWRQTGLPVHIFRLAGIYGPGRGPFEKVRNGTARQIIKPGQVFSRVHVEDIAQALELSMLTPNPGRVYNLCDDDPAPPEAVLVHAAQLLGLPPPPSIPFELAEMTPMARSFYSESKRVSNARAKAELGLHLRYPSYRDGLVAILREMQSQP